MKKRTPLSRNLITYIGWLIALVSFSIGVVLIVADFLFHQDNPYNAMVTYLMIPLLISTGAGIGLFGILLEWIRRKRKGVLDRILPVIDLNRENVRKFVFLMIIGAAIFFTVSSVGTYRAFVYTESTEFCGALCHQVMSPEFVAYQYSPHARVKCVECHIGEGAEWYARSKVNGLRQVYRTVLGNYNLPIQVPIHNLRPARETCEECHWPEKFTGTVERVQWHYWTDKSNTPSRYHILMKVGGTNLETGKSHDIHWHTSSQEIVRYWPKDPQRLEIPWVEVIHDNGTSTIYTNGDAPEGRPPESEIRTMDCIDCHNRPTHIYRSPDVMINRALSAGVIDPDLPWIKKKALELLSQDYENQSEAFDEIRMTLSDFYHEENNGKPPKSSVDQAVTELSEIFSRTQFPEQKVNWKTYPDHIGHRDFPGCFRCHNDEHESEEGETISMDCQLCHEFVYQAHGEGVTAEVKYQSQSFQHPGGEEDLWEDLLCTDCHAPED